MLISIFAGFIGDLFFLPALLKEFPNWLRDPKALATKSNRAVAAVGEEPEQEEHLSETPEILTKAAMFALVVTATLMIVPSIAEAAQAQKKASKKTVAAKPTSNGYAKAAAILNGKPTPATLTSRGRVPASAPVTDRGGGNEALEILKKARAKLASKSDQATVVLKIIEKNGEEKIREMDLKTLRDGKNAKALVRIQSPADVKGTALLAEMKAGSQQQWIYLPSTKQVRRISGSAGQGGILGSELNTSDLNPVAVKSAKAKLMSKDAHHAKILVHTKAKGFPYSHVILTMGATDALPQKAEYYKGKQLAKTVEFLNYLESAGVARAQMIRVRNPINQRGTDVEFKNIQINSGVKASDLTVEALKDDF